MRAALGLGGRPLCEGQAGALRVLGTPAPGGSGVAAPPGAAGHPPVCSLRFIHRQKRPGPSGRGVRHGDAAGLRRFSAKEQSLSAVG